jgi:uncharacterized cupredoxin-like copper-binding protein
MMKKFVAVFAISVVFALALSACGGPQSVTLDVDMVEFMFNPENLSVPAGAEVTINLSNSGTVEHEMVIFKQGIVTTPPVMEDFIEENVFWEEELEAGESGTFTFTAPSEPGEYQIICAIPGHFEAGMEGTLTVTP